MIIFSVIGLYYGQPELLENFEAETYDLRFKALRGPLKPSGKFVIVAIDEKSIEELGRFPWSREHFTKFIDVVSNAGAKGVLIDVLFPEPQEVDQDDELAAAIKGSGATILSVAFNFNPDGSIESVLENIPVLSRAAQGTAHINLFPDADGVIRWATLAIPYNGSYYPSFALNAAMRAVSVEAFSVDDYSIAVGSRKIPTDFRSGMLINYFGPPGTYVRYSFSDVVNGRVSAELLKDRVLLVGATALGIYDMRITPFSNNTPGIEVHANIAENILQGNFMVRGGKEALIDIFCIVFLGVVVSLVSLKLRAAFAFPLILVIAFGYLVFVANLFMAGRWVSIIYPSLSLVLTYAVTSYLRFFLLDRRSKAIRSIFSSYVSKKVVDELVKNPELAKVGGENKVITILFADVKNYTSFSERHEPQEVVKTLNEYLAEMTHVIMKYDGTLDKFMGDGILAYWGAPLDQDNHAELAVKCACEMLQRLKVLHEKWGAEGRETISCGIGINTGEVIVGNIGAEGKKLEYTVIGDNVNLTFRIQNESREVNCPVITKSLYDRVSDVVVAEPMGAVLVKGKEIPFDVFALKGIKEQYEPLG